MTGLYNGNGAWAMGTLASQTTHEALHTATGLGDVALANMLGIGVPGMNEAQAIEAISISLDACYH